MMAIGNAWAGVGNAANEPNLRYTPGGQSVATFGLAVNHRFQRDGQWEEKPSFIDVTCWGSLAENVSETVTRGQRVMVSGRLEQDTWEDKNTGDKRSKINVVADEVGPSLRWASAEVTKNERQDRGNGSGNTRQPVAASAPAGGGSGGWPDDEEPFIMDAAADMDRQARKRSF